MTTGSLESLRSVLGLLVRVHPVALPSLFDLRLIALVETVGDQVVADTNQAESAAYTSNYHG